MDFNSLLQQGATHAWLYLPVAVLLGALHGLEPGHSKTMMAAFIVAVRGTVVQAALLGLSAAISHSLVIWGLAALALKFGSQWNVETTEPYFQIGTGLIVIAMAAWTLWRTRRRHDHEHGQHHGEHADHDHHHDEADHDDDLDDHAREHAEDIQRRFAGREVTTGQIVLFGLTGGLMPCPAALSVLLVCLHLKRFTLGFSLVAAFSVGLALTLVTVGVVAAWGIRHVSERSGTLSRLANKAPALSSVVLIALGVVFILRGIWHLA